MRPAGKSQVLRECGMGCITVRRVASVAFTASSRSFCIAVFSARAFGEKHHAAIKSQWEEYLRTLLFSPLVTREHNACLCGPCGFDGFPTGHHAAVGESFGLEADTAIASIDVFKSDLAAQGALLSKF